MRPTLTLRILKLLSVPFVLLPALIGGEESSAYDHIQITSGAQPNCKLPLPSQIGVEAYENQLDAFLKNGCYLTWMHDREIRNTGPFIDQTTNPHDGQSFGVHPAVKVYYSPEVWTWLINHRRGEIPDGAMIVKEQYPAPARQEYTQRDRVGYSIMVRDRNASWDGWYWSSGAGLGNPYNPPYNYPWAGFGQYCLNCHASADNILSTFSSLRNITADPITYLTVIPSMDPKSDAEDPGLHQRITKLARLTAPAATQPPPDPAFMALFNSIKESDVPQPLRLPSESYDLVVQGPRPNGQKMFISSDQCIGCHDATQSNASLPNMIYVRPEDRAAVNLSPYAEWRSSMMGLSGRDPIFYAQVETERTLFPQLADQIDNKCFSCHGVMGQRQIEADRKQLFTHQMALATPSTDPQHATYGALARDGVSCTVCHHISAEGLGTERTYTGKFILGKDNDIYGPFDDVIKLPMENALGLTPRKTKENQIQSSALCGSCHTVDVPVLSDGGASIPDPLKNPKKTTHEQTTYFEWRNSIYSDEVKPVPSTAKRCQDCHMPDSYNNQRLLFRIANIEDNTFPFADNRAPDPEITLKIRGQKDRYSRHALHGINLFATKIFSQFWEALGIRSKDPMATWGNPEAGPVTAEKETLLLAQKETAQVEVTSVKRTAEGLEAAVRVTNHTGHKFPSGVGFRRAFIELVVLDAKGSPLWASGRTDSLGVIVDGLTDKRLGSEFFDVDPKTGRQMYQPHYSKEYPITRQDQAQIYEELQKNKEVDGVFTTSFLSLAHEVKDNRLMPKGWKLDGPEGNITKPNGGDGRPVSMSYYDGSGSDEVVYKINLGGARGRAASVAVTLYYQSIPPYYLQQRFTTAPQGVFTRNLWYFTSRLKVNERGSAIMNWKLKVVSASRTLGG